MDSNSDAFWELQSVGMMTPEHRNRFKSRASAFGLGPWELSILQAIWYGSGQVKDLDVLEWNAFGWYRDEWPDLARRYTMRCFEQGWILALTDQFLLARLSELKADGYLLARGLIGDHEYLNEETRGLISFSVAGAELYLRFLEITSDSDHWATTFRPDDPTATDVYGTSVEECESAAVSLSGDPPLRRSEIVPIGRWCDCWWRKFESGFYLRCWFAEHQSQ